MHLVNILNPNPSHNLTTSQHLPPDFDLTGQTKVTDYPSRPKFQPNPGSNSPRFLNQPSVATSCLSQPFPSSQLQLSGYHGRDLHIKHSL